MNLKLSEKAKASLDKVVEAFKGGTISDVIQNALNPAADAPCSKWSLRNRILVALSGSDDCRGFDQWKQVGRFVKKGSRATWILVPMTRKFTEKDEATGAEEEQRILSGFKACTVYRYEDTEGDEIDRPDYEPTEPPSLFGVAEKFGVSVARVGFLGNTLGTFSENVNEIHLMSPDEEVFWHELAHAAHSRVVKGLKGGQDPKQEAVAELTATVIARVYGRDITGNCWKYLSVYSKDPLDLCLSVLSDVSKVLDEIFQYVDAEAERKAA